MNLKALAFWRKKGQEPAGGLDNVFPLKGRETASEPPPPTVWGERDERGFNPPTATTGASGASSEEPIFQMAADAAALAGAIEDYRTRGQIGDRITIEDGLPVNFYVAKFADGRPPRMYVDEKALQAAINHFRRLGVGYRLYRVHPYYAPVPNGQD